MVGVFGVGALRSEAFTSLWYDGLALSLDALAGARIWTLVTYAWLHDLGGPLHLIANLVGLYFLAPELEARWRKRAFLRFFLICIVGGGVFAAVGAGLGGLFGAAPQVTVGASAGVMGLLAAWSMANPRRKLLLMFVLPVEGRYVLPIVLGLDALIAFSGSDTSFSAHIGGVVAAWLQLGGGRRWLTRLQKRRHNHQRAAMRGRPGA